MDAVDLKAGVPSKATGFTQLGIELNMRAFKHSILCFFLLAISLGCAHAEDQYFDSKGVKIRYIVEGKGEPVVLVHGITSSIEQNWAKLIKPLSESYEVIALDCRGHGKSDKPTDPKMYGQEMGEDVIRLMDHLHITKAHLVGYSMGAYISFGLMLIHPDRILTVTIGAGGGIPEPGTPNVLKAAADSLEKDKSFEPLIRALWPPKMAAPTPDQIKLFNTIMIGKRTDDDLKALVAVMRGGMGPAAEMSKEDLNEKLKACAIPILGIVGSDDPAKKNLENLQARLKELKGDKTGMTLIVIEPGNHADVPNKQEFVTGIQEFLKAHSSLDKAR